MRGVPIVICLGIFPLIMHNIAFIVILNAQYGSPFRCRCPPRRKPSQSVTSRALNNIPERCSHSPTTRGWAGCVRGDGEASVTPLLGSSAEIRARGESASRDGEDVAPEHTRRQYWYGAHDASNILKSVLLYRAGEEKQSRTYCTNRSAGGRGSAENVAKLSNFAARKWKEKATQDEDDRHHDWLPFAGPSMCLVS